MPTITFPELNDCTAENEAARRGVAALDWDTLEGQHFSRMDVTEGDISVRINRVEGGQFVVQPGVRFVRRFPAAAEAMDDARNGRLGTYPNRSAALAAATALIAAVRAEG